MLKLNGTKQFSQTAAVVWPKLIDMQFLVDCLPDLQTVKSVTGDHAEAVLRPGFSFARTEMQLAIDQVEVTPPTAATFKFATKGIGSSSQVEARFQLLERDAGSEIQWSAEVQHLGGLLKAVPSGLIQGGAEKVINDLLSRIEQRLESIT